MQNTKANILKQIILTGSLCIMIMLLSVSVTLAILTDARSTYVDLEFGNGVTLQVDNLTGVAGSRTLTMSGPTGAVFPGAEITITAPTIKLAPTSSDAYVRWHLDFAFAHSDDPTVFITIEEEPLIIFVFAMLFTLDFTYDDTKFSEVPGSYTSYFHYINGSNNKMTNSSPASGIPLWSSLTILINESATPELANIILRLTVRFDAMQANNYTESAAWATYNITTYIPL